MNIVIIGRDNVGGGLAAQWRRTGHQVTAPGRGGRDASGATVAAMAVPGPALEDLTWLLIGAMEDGAPIFYRLGVPGGL
jgi:predicted dinucleotide-binding enzyme